MELVSTVSNSNDTIDTKDEIDDTNLERIIIRLIGENPSVTNKELVDLTGVSIATIKRTMSVLKKKGIIVREGSNRAGIWLVNEK